MMLTRNNWKVTCWALVGGRGKRQQKNKTKQNNNIKEKIVIPYRNV